MNGLSWLSGQAFMNTAWSIALHPPLNVIEFTHTIVVTGMTGLSIGAVIGIGRSL